jgi:Reverse transcriptase (RNA-dependent DNA polymerase)
MAEPIDVQINDGIDVGLDGEHATEKWWAEVIERNNENGMELKHFICLKCPQERHQKYKNKGQLTKHMDNKHSREFEGDAELRKCVDCQRFFVGEVGIQRHRPNCKGRDNPIVPVMGGAGENLISVADEDGAMFYKETYQKATYFLRYFRHGLFETSDAVLELYGVAFIHLIGEAGRPNVTDGGIAQNEKGRWCNLLALYVLPGMLSFVTKYRVVGTALPLLRRLVLSDALNAGNQLAFRILDEAVNMIRTNWHSGERPELLEKAASKGTVSRHLQKAEEQGRTGRIGAAARECEAANKLLTRKDDHNRHAVDIDPALATPLTFEQQLEVIARHFPKFRNERLDTLPDVAMEDEPEGTRLSEDHVRQAIESVNKASSAGPDGTTSRLLWLLYESLGTANLGNDTRQKEFLNKIRTMAQGLADGIFGQHSMDLLNMVRVSIFGEKRVIGIRSALMRLVLKAIVVANMAQQDVSLPFRETAQLGVGVPGGTTIAARMLQDAYDREVEVQGTNIWGAAREEKDDEGRDLPGSRQYMPIYAAGAAPAILSTDVSKCFQHIAVASVYEEIKDKGLNKGLVRLLRALYGKPTMLVNSKGKLLGMREIGVLQGCILSMLFNNYGLRRVDSKILELMGDARRMAKDLIPPYAKPLQDGTVRFADDGYIYGPIAVILCIYPMLDAIYGSEGLKLNKAKCKLLSHYCKLLDVDVLSHEGSDMSLRIAEMLPDCQFAENGMTALGVPIGLPCYVRNAVRQSVEANWPPVEALMRIGPVLAMNMIALVYNTQFDYLFSAIAPHLSADSRSQLDGQIDKALAAVMQVATQSEEMDYLKWLRGLSLQEGGLGIRRKDHPAMVIQTRINQQRAANYVIENMPHRQPIMGGRYIDMATPMTLPNRWVPATNEPEYVRLRNWQLTTEEVVVLEGTDLKAMAKTKKDCISRYDKDMAEGLHNYVLTTKQDNARAAVFLSNRNKRPSTWILSNGGTPIPAQAYLNFLRHRALQPLQNVADGRRLEHCGYCADHGSASGWWEALKTNFAHATSCVHCTGYTNRHDELVDLLAKYCHKLIPEHCQVTKEQFVIGGSGAEAVVAPVAHADRILQHQNGGQRRRGGQAGVRMDLVVKVGNKEYWIDVAVVDPGCNTYLDKGSATLAGAAAKTREADKRNRLKQRKPDFDMEGATPKFIPFVVEVSGKLGESAQQFIQTVGIPGQAIRKLQMEIGTLLAKHTGFMLCNMKTRCIDVGRRAQIEAEESRCKRRRTGGSGEGAGDAI